MKIGIEGHRLFRERKHGMEIVALELVKELQQIDHENEYFIYVKPDVDHDCIKPTENFHIVELKGESFPFWEQHTLPKAAQNDGCDMLHCTSNTAPLHPKMPLLLTLHDIIYLEQSYFEILADKGTNYQRFGNMYRRYIVPDVVKKANVIITVSQFEKKRIADFFGIQANDERLRVVYNGVSHHFKHIDNINHLNRVKVQYKLPEEFIIFLGNTAPKKNTTGVVKAFSEFMKQSDKNLTLVILDFSQIQLKKLLFEIGDPGLKKHIHLTGYVANLDLPAIFSLSQFFLYPSLRESFGIPILEAMSCGTPVITSNTSSMPEISEGAAITVDPFKPEQITDAMNRLFNDENLRHELIQKGYAQAVKFSWRAMAENVLELYKEVYKKIK